MQFFSGTQGVIASTWNDLPSDASNLGGYIIEREDRPVLARSGFYGQAFAGGAGSNLLTPVSGTPVRTIVSVYNSGGKIVSRIGSNPVGQFYLYLKPGQYTLIATLPNQKFPPRNLSKIGLNSFSAGEMLQITVNPNQLTPVEKYY